MDRRAPGARLFILLLIVPLCTALRIPTTLGKFGLVPSVLRAGDTLNAEIHLQDHAQHQHLIKPMRESGAADGTDDHGPCLRLNGFRLAHCQRLRFERFLADDYEDAQANVNVVFAPLPA